MKFSVVEIFQSINGEGKKAGELAVFVRMKGCNLCCAYCDTAWANEMDAKCEELTTEQIIERISAEKVKNVTLTGGEPLLQKGMETLLKAIVEAGYCLEIETNGSVFLGEFQKIDDRISFTMDYKLGDSKMESKMCMENFSVLEEKDTVKFVVSGREDLERAYEVWEKYLKGKNVPILLSPVFGAIEAEEIVVYMKEHHWVESRMQIQLHKVIWDPMKRGV